MSKTVKIWLIIATVLIILGVILFAGVMAAYDWDFTKLSTVTYVTNTYDAYGEFDKISINVDTTDIEFVLTEDEACSIVCYEAEKVRHSAKVQNGTLVIKTIDTRKWYDHICISLGNPKMTVYLPQNEYASLIIETDTGNITVPKEFSFETLKIDGDTSNADCFASVLGAVEIEVSTGNINIDTVSADQVKLTTSTGGIKVNSVTVKNDIHIETDTGKITLTDTSCTDLTAESDTGTMTLKNVAAEGRISAMSDTGDVKFEDSDAAQISVKTSTGDVTGTLLSEKVFITETSTGRISVPETTSGGRCEITTSTGNINMSIRQ